MVFKQSSKLLEHIRKYLRIKKSRSDWNLILALYSFVCLDKTKVNHPRKIVLSSFIILILHPS